MQEPLNSVVLLFNYYFMKSILLTISLLLFVAIGFVKAQPSDTIPCPALQLKGPKDNKVAEGKELTVSVVPLGKQYEKYELTYNWSLSNGEILKGQGTSKIYIDTRGMKDQSTSIMVEISGLKAGCENTAALFVDIIADKPKR